MTKPTAKLNKLAPLRGYTICDLTHDEEGEGFVGIVLKNRAGQQKVLWFINDEGNLPGSFQIQDQ